MDLVKLHETTYLPVGEVIEGYSSLIWSERVLDFSDFELKTYDVARFEELLPEGAFVSHLETREMFIVETHSIDVEGEGDDALEVLTIKGRTAVKILDERWIESGYQKKRPMRRKYGPVAAVEVLIFNAINNLSGKDVTRGDPSPFIYELGSNPPEQNDFAWNTKDALPNIELTETTTEAATARLWQLEQGVLYPQLKKIMDAGDVYVRCLRPVSPNAGRVVTVKTNLAERGEIVRTQKSNITAGRFDIFQGVDRSDTVKFSRLQGHLEKPVYLRSSQGLRTALEVMSGGIVISDVYRPGTGGYSGWDRRVSGFDAGSPEIPNEPEKPAELKKNATKDEREKRQNQMDNWIDAHARWRNKRDNILKDFREETELMAQRELKASRRINMFTSDISPLAPFTYKTDYDLGDLVTLIGDRGLATVMRVVEYVRTEDDTGDRGLPGLAAP